MYMCAKSDYEVQYYISFSLYDYDAPPVAAFARAIGPLSGL